METISKMNRFEWLEDDYEDLPSRTKIKKKPSKFEREGSLTEYLKIREAERNGAKRRKERYSEHY